MYSCHCSTTGGCWYCDPYRYSPVFYFKDFKMPITVQTRQLSGTLSKDDVIQAIRDYVAKQFPSMRATDVILLSNGAAEFKVESAQAAKAIDYNYR